MGVPIKAGQQLQRNEGIICTEATGSLLWLASSVLVLGRKADFKSSPVQAHLMKVKFLSDGSLKTESARVLLSSTPVEIISSFYRNY